MLRDRLACGINDQTIQRKMLVEKDLTFKRALEIAEGTQAADQNYREMRAVKVKEEPVKQVASYKISYVDRTVIDVATQAIWATPAGTRRRYVETATRRDTWPECVPMHLESRALRRSHEIETQIETVTGRRHGESDKLRRNLTVRRLRRLATSGR